MLPCLIVCKYCSDICVSLSLSTPNLLTCLQAFQLWLQYTSLLGTVNVSLPKTVSWLPKAASFAFSSLTSGGLSTDCLLNVSSTNVALQRLLLRLAVLPTNLLVLAALQTLW